MESQSSAPYIRRYARNRVLKQLCAAIVVAMSVRQDDIFHLARIQTYLLQAVQNFIFRGIVEQSLDHDNPFAAGERPSAVNRRAEEIEIIGDLGRFGILRFPGGRTATRSAPAGSSRQSTPTRRCGRRRDAEPQKRPCPTCAGWKLLEMHVAARSQTRSAHEY
jgi:hypothetical protein